MSNGISTHIVFAISHSSLKQLFVGALLFLKCFVYSKLKLGVFSLAPGMSVLFLICLVFDQIRFEVKNIA